MTQLHWHFCPGFGSRAVVKWLQAFNHWNSGDLAKFSIAHRLQLTTRTTPNPQMAQQRRRLSCGISCRNAFLARLKSYPTS